MEGEKTLERWARRLELSGNRADAKGKWTRTLIKAEHIKAWMTRPYGEMTFHITQLFTGHCCFNSYLYKIARAPSPGFAHCGFSGEENEIEDDVEHILMYCEAFDHERERLISKIGPYETNDIVQRILESPTQWAAVVEFAERVMLEKENSERELEKRQEGILQRRPRGRHRGRRKL